MYHLLTNPIYLYCLQHPELNGTKLNFSKIGEELLITRQTATKLYATLINNEVDPYNNFLGITNFYPDVQDHMEQAMLILRDLKGDMSAQSYAKMLGVSASTTAKRIRNMENRPLSTQEKTIISGVYAILHNNEIIYIGSSGDVENRLNQHKHNLTLALSGLACDTCYLYEYCKLHCKLIQELTFMPLMYTVHYKEAERIMIHTIKPKCNIMSNIEAKF